jgi:hypothetical protein
MIFDDVLSIGTGLTKDHAVIAVAENAGLFNEKVGRGRNL